MLLDLLRTIRFPDPRTADGYGLVALGGSYQPAMLLAAYAQGIFPWPSEDMPYAWFSPDPRMILPLEEFHISRSLRRELRRSSLRVTWDQAFDRVIAACAAAPRPGQEGTWISEELREGFEELHRHGFAHSVETWQDEELVGGVYGLSLGRMFCGESMFFHRPNASKVALAHLVEGLRHWDFHFLDCQVHTPHMEHFGAREWTRDRFLRTLAKAIEAPTRRGPWPSQGPRPSQ